MKPMIDHRLHKSSTWPRRGLTEGDVAEYLGIKVIHVVRLQKTKIFPKPISQEAVTKRWSEKSIRTFKRIMKEYASRGWKTPDCLLLWQDTGDRGAEVGISARRSRYRYARKGK